MKVQMLDIFEVIKSKGDFQFFVNSQKQECSRQDTIYSHAVKYLLILLKVDL